MATIRRIGYPPKGCGQIDIHSFYWPIHRDQSRIVHGCENGAPTEKVSIKVPEKMSIRPSPVAGWNMTFGMRPLDPPVTSHGKTINTTIDTVTWTLLPGNQPVGRVEFAVVQTCVGGIVNAYDKFPKNDEERKKMEDAAPGIMIIEPNTTTTNAAAPAQQQGQDKKSGASVAAASSMSALVLALAAIAGTSL
ncbi:hypothetical protein BCR44DRAFT_1438963 [Catenaria anguillulae PL171]|uniref:YncI copper-binding domain-containing protein n=1 Tax=Catenaria anguillulae PL171 TaxID=765915 RepID=A0A1Y2HEQ3_9FUNG|nr:hypothetical protein BCR44DRAFT_1438963 [Catenaria anguillulae PL171]